MKLANLIYYTTLFALCFSTAASAQSKSDTPKIRMRYTTEKEAGRWFVEGGIGMQTTIIKGDFGLKYLTPTVQLGAGRWFSPVSGARINLEMGNVYNRYFQAQGPIRMSSVRAAYMMNISNLVSVKVDRPFQVIANFGASLDFIDKSNRDYSSKVLHSASLGVMGLYKVSPRVGVFIEPGITFTSDHLDGVKNSTYDYLFKVMFGVRVKIGNKGFKAYSPTMLPEYNIDVENVNSKIFSAEKELNECIDKNRAEGIEAGQYKWRPLEQLNTSRKVFSSTRFVDNTFISIGGIIELPISRKNTFKNVRNKVGLGAFVAAGKWFDSTWGVQVNLSGAQVKHYKSSYFAGTADFMLNLSNVIGGYRADRLFSVIPFGGLGVAYTTANKGATSLATTWGIQGRFRASERVNIFVEARGYSMSHKISYIGSRYTVFGGARLGVSYKFGKSTMRPYSYNKVQYIKSAEARYAEIEQAILYEKSKLLVAQTASNMAADTVVPDLLVVDVKFPAFSSYVDDKQMKVLANIAEWIEGRENFTAKIAAYQESDQPNKVRQRRENAIKQILIEKFNVPAEKISIVTPQELGYSDLKSSNAIVIFNEVL